MEFGLLSFLVALAVCMLAMAMERRKSVSAQLPPGPRAWPVVGNLFQLSLTRPYESLTKLAQKYGPVMTVHLGSMTTVVVSTADAAQEMFKNHDAALAGRKIYEVMKGGHGTDGSIITAQYGPYWRMLRRLCTLEFFSKTRLDQMLGVRRKCVDRMVRYVEEAGSRRDSVDVGKLFHYMALNLIGNLMFSGDLMDPASKMGADFFYHAGKAMELAGKPNVADFLSFVRWFDPQRIRKNMDFHVGQGLKLVAELTKDTLERQGKEEERYSKDYLNVLMEFRGDGVEEPVKFSSRVIDLIVLEMFIAATDTTTSTLEWAMAELLRNSRILNKVQAELRRVVGSHGKVEERHVQDLPYLKAVIKETLRLHPPIPFLVPHKAMSSCKMLGYSIPQETQVFVNVWAIGRDPKSWEDPLVFKPERFMELSHIDYKGHNYEFIPFGSSRRMCPAVPLASRLLPLALGSLLHSFDWILADDANPETMDMSNRMGMTLKKAIPLRAIPIPHKKSLNQGSS